METREKVFAAVGVIGVIVAIVALVIAVSAQNNTTSDSELSAQVKTELQAELGSAKAQIDRQQRRTAAGAAGAASKANKAEAKASKSKSSIKSLEAQITKLDGEVKQLTDSAKTQTREIANIKQEQQATAAKVDKLNAQVKGLKQTKKNR